jgi:hypothetical protein
MLTRNGIVSVEPVGWRSGQVVFLPLSQPEPTGSILGEADLYAMRGPSNPRTTTISKKSIRAFLFPF